MAFENGTLDELKRIKLVTDFDSLLDYTIYMDTCKYKAVEMIEGLQKQLEEKEKKNG